MVSEVALVKLPLPLEVHVIPVSLVADEPAVMFTAPELEQVVTAVPATAVGAAVIVKFFVDTALAQGPLPVAVKVKVIVPVSPAPGV